MEIGHQNVIIIQNKDFNELNDSQSTGQLVLHTISSNHLLPLNDHLTDIHTPNKLSAYSQSQLVGRVDQNKLGRDGI